VKQSRLILILISIHIKNKKRKPDRITNRGLSWRSTRSGIRKAARICRTLCKGISNITVTPLSHRPQGLTLTESRWERRESSAAESSLPASASRRRASYKSRRSPDSRISVCRSSPPLSCFLITATLRYV